jgi:hypothetical protein
MLFMQNYEEKKESVGLNRQKTNTKNIIPAAIFVADDPFFIFFYPLILSNLCGY